VDALELRQLIATGETLHLDLKERFSTHRELAKDLVCFANTDGGVVLFGVTDDRTVVGIGDVDRLAVQVDEVAYEHCEPPVTAVTEAVELDGRTVVAVRVPKGDARPYRTKSGQYYVRTAARCRAASREELLRLFQATESLYYDETPLRRTSLADLDLAAVERFLSDAGLEDLAESDVRRLLRNWRLYDGQHLTLAGLVLFGADPQRELPYTGVVAARFPGSDSGADPDDRTDLGGRLLDVIDQASSFLRLHLRTAHEIRGFEPERRPELPEEVLREAVVNALVHRDYTVRGPVRLFVFDDRVEVHSPGTTPNSVDEDAMRAGVHVVRNPHIYSRLSDAGLVTRAGTGVRRMNRLLVEATGRGIGIDVRDFEVLVTIPRRDEASHRVEPGET
jgi:ATP-dependent DNA helicase RecG